MEISTKVHPPTKDVPVIDYLSTRFTYRPHASWAALVETGHVRINGRVCGPAATVSAGDRLTTTLPDARQPDANFGYEIVFEDPWLLGIDKPPGLRVHGRGAFIHANLIHHLRHVRAPAYPEAELVNRLDADTSGLVLVARGKETLRVLQAQFREREVEKRYLALVHGIPEPSEGVIDRPLGRVPGAAGVYRYGSGPQVLKPRSAVTAYRLVESFDFNGNIGFIELRPLSGRTHQLRAHLAGQGHPLVGDRLYTLSDDAFLRWFEAPGEFPPALLRRQALHSAALVFRHPDTGERREIVVPLAADMAALLNRLRNH